MWSVYRVVRFALNSYENVICKRFNGIEHLICSLKTLVLFLIQVIFFGENFVWHQMQNWNTTDFPYVSHHELEQFSFEVLCVGVKMPVLSVSLWKVGHSSIKSAFLISLFSSDILRTEYNLIYLSKSVCFLCASKELIRNFRISLFFSLIIAFIFKLSYGIVY